MTPLPDMLDLDPAGLIADAFAFVAGVGPAKGFLEVFEEPEPDGVYCAGSDHGLGIERRDWDCGCVLRVDCTPFRQVAEARGHWGEEFIRVLYPLVRWYADAFLCPERNSIGLWVIRQLIDRCQYVNLYREKETEKIADKPTQKVGFRVGFQKHRGHTPLPTLRVAVREGTCILRSKATLDQMARCQWAPTGRINPESAVDEQLGVKLIAERGGPRSPDFVMAAAYALVAAPGAMQARTQRRKPQYAAQSWGAVLGHDSEDDQEPQIQASRREGRGSRVES